MATGSRWLRGRLATVLLSEATASTSSKDAIAIANAKPVWTRMTYGSAGSPGIFSAFRVVQSAGESSSSPRSRHRPKNGESIHCPLPSICPETSKAFLDTLPRSRLRAIPPSLLLGRVPHSRFFGHIASLAAASTSFAAPGTMLKNFENVLKDKYPAKAHAKRVVDQIRKSKPDANGVIYLEACATKMQEDNDSPVPFRQRRYFYYLTGCDVADCSLAYDIQSGKSILFIPPVDADDVIWSGLPLSIDDALQKYDVDEVKFTTEVNATLTHLAKNSPKSTVFAIANQVSDHVTFLQFVDKDFETVKTAIEVSRVVKDEYEVAMIQKANHIASQAHKAVIERSKSARTEQELYATFLERCVSKAAPEMPYHPIVAAGRAAATLHYVDNNASLSGKLNVLIDAGCEWNNYASDITRTFPLTGEFTKESRDIYAIVYRMQKECTERLKGGILWDDVHLHAHRIAVEGLLSLGILKGDVQEILDARTSAAFFPHGLGHHLGLDTHDTGGNPNPNDKDKLFRYLRLRGHVPAGAVVTVEPGIYFCDFIIKPYLKDPTHSKYIDSEVLDRYWDVGGIRLEDNIFVTADGYENLTPAMKEMTDVEAAATRS
ncbi:hypothetical protein E4U59_001012 [Claviceps monticola]|nr:hypothetical protein E4U59_001012 [Claviceps monticola]